MIWIRFNKSDHIVKWVLIVASVVSCASCSREPIAAREAQVELRGPPGAQVEILRVAGEGVRATDPRQLLPLGNLQTGKTYSFPPGSYYALNECSAYFFELQADGNLVLNVQLVTLKRSESTLAKLFPRQDLRQEASESSDGNGRAQSEILESQSGAVPSSSGTSLSGYENRPHVVPVTCRHALTGERTRYETRTEFELLPGQVSLSIGGRRVVPDELRNEPFTHEIVLYPILVDNFEGRSADPYFALPKSGFVGSEPPAVACPIGDIQWLPEGDYDLELNGTRMAVTIGQSGMFVQLGAIEILSPENFPLAERLRSGGAPPYAYIDGGVLITLGTIYPVFPGQYVLSLDGSDLTKSIAVESGKKTQVVTTGAAIQMPTCDQATACSQAALVSIHTAQKPFTLMSLEAGMPFLVWDEDFEYGVEGLKGVFRKLGKAKQDIFRESLSRLKIVWQMRPAAPKVKTDLVRLETDDSSLYGKSLDLLVNQPKELIVPPGRYLLTYFVGDPNGERKKQSQAVSLVSGQTAEIVVPIYTDKAVSADKVANSDNDGSASDVPADQVPDQKPQSLPRRLKPLKRGSGPTPTESN